MNNKNLFVFLPGVPGRRKDYAFMLDFRELGIESYEYRHPGLYEEPGTFSLSNTLSNITEYLDGLESRKKSFSIISYSFSTYLISELNLNKYKYLNEVFLFSPVMGLGLDWINEDFEETITNLVSQNECHPSENMWNELHNSFMDNQIESKKASFLNFNFPLYFIYSVNDNAIKIEKLQDFLKNFVDKKI